MTKSLTYRWVYSDYADKIVADRGWDKILERDEMTLMSCPKEIFDPECVKDRKRLFNELLKLREEGNHD